MSNIAKCHYSSVSERKEKYFKRRTAGNKSERVIRQNAWQYFGSNFNSFSQFIGIVFLLLAILSNQNKSETNGKMIKACYIVLFVGVFIPLVIGSHFSELIRKSKYCHLIFRFPFFSIFILTLSERFGIFTYMPSPTV